MTMPRPWAAVSARWWRHRQTASPSSVYGLYDAPPLGALVRCSEGSPIYGVVGQVATTSLDPSRRPIARGRREDTEEAVYRSNPQLERLLRTEFRALVVGHALGGRT